MDVYRGFLIKAFPRWDDVVWFAVDAKTGLESGPYPSIKRLKKVIDNTLDNKVKIAKKRATLVSKLSKLTREQYELQEELDKLSIKRGLLTKQRKGVVLNVKELDALLLTFEKQEEGD